MPSSRSTLCSTAASRARVSRLPSPASIRRRVLPVSSKVRFPELPDARMDTRKPIAFLQCSQPNFQNHRRAHPCRQRNSIEVAKKFSRRRRTQGSIQKQSWKDGLAGQAGAVQSETIERAEYRHSDLLRAEEFLG